MRSATHWRRLRPIVLGLAIIATSASALARRASAQDAAPPPKERQSQTGDSSRRLVRAEDMIALLHRSNQVEIEGATLALERGQAGRVKSFAAVLITEHQRCDKQLREYADRMGVHERTFGDGKRQASDGPLERLRVRQPQDFDRAFILAMVREHGRMIDALTSTMEEKRNSGDADLLHLLAGQLPVLEKLKKTGELILARLPANSGN